VKGRGISNSQALSANRPSQTSGSGRKSAVIALWAGAGGEEPARNIGFRSGGDRRGGAVFYDAAEEGFLPELLEIAAPLLLGFMMPIAAHQRVVIG
jgi:hypothetical protein